MSLGDTKLGSRAKYLDPDPGDILMMKPPPSVALGRDEAQASSSQDASYQIGDLFGQPRNGKSPPFRAGTSSTACLEIVILGNVCPP